MYSYLRLFHTFTSFVGLNNLSTKCAGKTFVLYRVHLMERKQTPKGYIDTKPPFLLPFCYKTLRPLDTRTVAVAIYLPRVNLEPGEYIEVKYATWRKVHRKYAEYAELSISVSRRLWRTLRRCAHNGHRGIHTVLKFLGCQLQSDLYTLHYSWPEDEQLQLRATSSCKAVQRRFSGKDSWNHVPWWHQRFHFSWEGHSPHDSYRWHVRQKELVGCFSWHQFLLKTR